MKRSAFALLLFFLVLSACAPGKKEQKKTTLTKNSLEFNQKKTHSFSGLDTRDTFEVNLSGTKPSDMVLKFTITSSSGEKIYTVNIKATDLLGSTDPNVDLRKESDQIEFIQNIAHEFLSEENFLVPAVTSQQVIDDYTPDKDFFQELKTTGLNGFTYRLGKENNIYLAWSTAAKKVKIYYNCC